MDITSLKTYLEVYKMRHFGKAASNLFVTQSAVSARIRQLEEKLGVKLFTRDRNNIQPTSAGRKFFTHAESIMNAWNRAQLNIALEDDKRIHVVVAGIPSLWDIYLDEWLISANGKFPNVVLSCEALSHDSITQRLIEGIVDIGFGFDPPQHQSLHAVRNFPINLVMVSSHENLDAQKAVEEDYIYVDWGTSFAAAHSSFFTESPVPPVRIAMAHIALDIINRRGGSAFLPESMVGECLEKGTLYRVADAPVIQREAHFTYRKGSDREDLILEIINSG